LEDVNFVGLEQSSIVSTPFIGASRPLGPEKCRLHGEAAMQGVIR